MNENPRERGKVISLQKIESVVGKVMSSSSIDETTKSELKKWQQDYIYRGGELGSGREAAIPRDSLVPSLQAPQETPNITWIPGIMRANGWTEGAILLDEWLRRPKNIRSNKLEDTPNNFGPAVLNVVTMDWILSFKGKSPITVYNNILKEKIWSNKAGVAQIGKVLGRTGITVQAIANKGQRVPFGDLTSSNVITIEENHVQYRKVEIFSYYDGLTAAIANFNFHVAVKGSVVYTGSNLEITINEVGVYARDSYDFINDGSFYMLCLCYDQPLGNWGKYVGNISNDSFNDWRDATGRGGDFLVYSDIKVTKLASPDIFSIPVN